MPTNEQIIADIAVLKEQQSYLKDYVGDQIKICTGEIKEHINKVGALQKVDIQASRDYCETENNNLYNAIGALKDRMNKVAYGAVGAVGVISVIAWAFETFAK